jgi:hypothetical protein
MKISVYDILNSHNALLHDDGLLVYKAVKAAFDERDEILIDFTDVKKCTSLFLNASFGLLLHEFGAAKIDNFIKPVNFELINNFDSKYQDVRDNIINRSNYQAFFNEAFA